MDNSDVLLYKTRKLRQMEKFREITSKDQNQFSSILLFRKWNPGFVLLKWFHVISLTDVIFFQKHFSCNFSWNCSKYVLPCKGLSCLSELFLVTISAKKSYSKCLLVFRKSHWISHIFSSQPIYLFDILWKKVFPLFSSLVNDILICYLFFTIVYL